MKDTTELPRQRKILEEALCNEALSVPTETDKLIPYLDHAIAVWNSQVDDLDRKFGRGYFSLRMVRVNAYTFRFEGNWTRAISLLEFLKSRDAKPVYQWMADLLLVAGIPEAEFKRQATARDGYWNKVLRK